MKRLIEEWKELAEERQEDSFRFLTWLKGAPDPRRVDRTAQEAHDEVFDEIDCTRCANCCKTTSPVITDADAARIALLLAIPEEEFRSDYLKKSEDDEIILKTRPCPFLKDDKCSIYDDRPDACRGFPFTREKGFNTRRYMHTANTTECPAVFHIVEQMKRRTGWRGRR